MKRIFVWDIFVRVFHWSLVIAFFLNAFVVDDHDKIHQYIGYFIVVLILARIVWGFVGSRYARFSSFPPSVKLSVDQAKDMVHGKDKVYIGHTPLGSLMIYNLIFTLLLIGLSGYLMTTDRFWGEEWPEEMHEALVLWAEICVVFHILAVIYESVKTKVNLPLAMFSGYKEIPKDELN